MLLARGEELRCANGVAPSMATQQEFAVRLQLGQPPTTRGTEGGLRRRDRSVGGPVKADGDSAGECTRYYPPAGPMVKAGELCSTKGNRAEHTAVLGTVASGAFGTRTI